MNTKKKITILSILISLILVVTTTSITYAIWSSKHVTSYNIVTSGCLNIEYNELSDEINLQRIGPSEPSIKEDPEAVIPGVNQNSNINDENTYYLSITNKCEIVTDYEINLETLNDSNLESKNILLDVKQAYSSIYDLTFEDFKGILNDNYLYYKYNIKDIEEPLILNDLENRTPTISNASNSKNVFNYSISPNKTHYFAFSLSLNPNIEDGDDEEKTWKGKFIVNSTPSKAIKVTFDTNGGEMDITDKLVYTNTEYGKLPKPEKEGYNFKYWYLDDDETKGINERSVVNSTSDYTLKAKYVDKNEKATLRENEFYKHLTQHPMGFIKEDDKDYKINLIPFEGYMTEEEQWKRFGSAWAIWSDDTYECEDYGECRYNVLFFMESNYEGDVINMYYYQPNTNIAISKDRFCGAKSYLSQMELYYRHLRKIDLSGIDTSQMTDMTNMFRDCESLEEVVLTGVDSSNVTSMDSMFMNCKNLKVADLHELKDDSLESISSMFEGCTSLERVDLSGFSGKPLIDNYMLCGIEHNINIKGYTPSESVYCLSNPDLDQ